MKVVFVVQGEGRGHMTQAITMKELLCSNGHEVTKVLVGRSKSRSLPDFFKRNSGAGISADDFDISRLISFADTFKPNNGFRQSANNSEFMFLPILLAASASRKRYSQRLYDHLLQPVMRYLLA